MNKFVYTFVLLISLIVIFSCSNEKPHIDKTSGSEYGLADTIDVINVTRNLLTDYVAIYEDGDINVAIEIPTGTREKWEIDKLDGKVKLEFIDSIPRIIDYLGYPGNYGMIPRTIVSKELGGDGDPLDVIVLGEPLDRGSIVKCKIIGVLLLLDRGEIDDKLIAVRSGTSFYKLNNLKDLNEYYNGIPEILQMWFTNYKGPGKMESKGFGDKIEATNILNSAIEEYNNR